ncbi:SufB/SufD family protein [Ruixingdingia sedimenti]|uniref:SufD family Fe-S cluster assembly protein n=1 Tax=Ruixingdingia sedimenti TaxID=3073604 RepID=A0ABU1FC68_9RHOB|nr:SufD family Fe-S cluster assembly protein [Xinfangfangia sp. LG-4]MDR5654496.1 SufD family Fe-S cluster assembly protein [Xinfangfangia sp. LG-4]
MALAAVQMKQRQEALETRLAALPQPGPAGQWLTAARGAAAARLAGMGLPLRRDEYWRYTDPATLNAATALPSTPFQLRDEKPAFEDVDRLRLVFVDGVFDAAASDDPVMAGVEIARLADAGATDIHWARDLYGVLEARGQTPVARPFAALNTAYARDGVLIRVTGQAARPVSLIYRYTRDTSDVMLHHVIRLEPGADLTLLENGPGAARFDTVTEVDVADGARFHHVRVQGRDRDRRAVTHMFARLGTRSLFKSFTLTANGRLTRNEAVVDLTGPDAIAHVAGAAVGDGAFLHDDTVYVIHGAERCESRQVFKKVLKHGAVGVFQGKIHVHAQAQKTDGYQISQSLLLDEESQFLAKPELEIYADDVKCSHGSTSGAIDATALYYLRSRGVPLRAAQQLLIEAFLAEAIDEVENTDIAEELRSRLRRWLERRNG